MARIIELTVTPAGEASVQTKGYAGNDCLAASKFLEEALGVVSSDRKSAEYYNVAHEQQQIVQQ